DKMDGCRLLGLGHDTTDPEPCDPGEGEGGGEGGGECEGDCPPTNACVPSCGDFHPKQTIKRSEELTFNGCTVRFVYNAETGQVEDVFLPIDINPDTCNLLVNEVENLEVKLNGTTLGMGTFGDGYISTGSSSCTTRVVAGKAYSWGKPC